MAGVSIQLINCIDVTALPLQNITAAKLSWVWFPIILTGLIKKIKEKVDAEATELAAGGSEKDKNKEPDAANTELERSGSK